MSLVSDFLLGVRILRFDRDAVHTIAADESIGRQELVWTGIAALFGGILVAFLAWLSAGWFPSFFSSYDPVGYALRGFIIGLAGILVLLLVVTGLTHLVAKLFGGQASFQSYYGVIALTALPLQLVSFVVSFLALLPFGSAFQFLNILYALAISVFIVREIYAFSTVRAFFTTLVPLVILACILLMLFAAVIIALIAAVVSAL